MHDVKGLAAQAEALAIIYATACQAYTTANIRSSMKPENHQLYRHSMDLWIARDYAWRELLASVNRLIDADEAIVGRNILQSAASNAHVAECEAMRRELAAMKGAA